MRTFRTGCAVVALLVVAVAAGACSRPGDDPNADAVTSTTVASENPVGELLDALVSGGPVTVTANHNATTADGVSTDTTTVWRSDTDGNVTITVSETRDGDSHLISESVFDGATMWWRDAATSWTATAADTPAARAITWFDLGSVAAQGEFDAGQVTVVGAVVDADGYLHDVDRFDVSATNGRLTAIDYTAAISDPAGNADPETWTIELRVTWGDSTPVTVPGPDTIVGGAWNSAPAVAANLQANLLWAVTDTDLDPANVAAVETAAMSLPANVKVTFDDDIDGNVAGRTVSFDDGTSRVCLTIGDRDGNGWSISDGACA